MINTIYQIIRTARVRQWLKNLSLFAAPIFSGLLFKDEVMRLSIMAFVAFCFLSSGIYFLNDLIDVEKDRKHPVKKNRPIASGKLSPLVASLVGVLFVFGSILFAYIYIGNFFTLAMVTYMFMQIFYTFYFKNVIILDSLFLAAGFVLRVFAGGLASYTSLSSWLALTVIGLSLLMAFGKRRSEKTILNKYDQKFETRKTLEHYPDNLLDSMITMSATYTIMAYSLFSFQVPVQTVSHTLSSVLPGILKNPKWMMITIPLVLYGIARYLYVIYEKGEEGESPERVLLSDFGLLSTVIFWGILVMAIVYGLPIIG